MLIIGFYFIILKNAFNTYTVGCKHILIASQTRLALFFIILLPFCANAYEIFYDPTTNLEVINVNPGNSIASGFIRTMEMDHRQVLWLATDDGLYYLDDKGFHRFMNFKLPIFDVLEDKHGRLWVTTQSGLQVINQKRNHSIPLSELGLKAIFAATKNMQVEQLPNHEMAILAGGYLYRYTPLTRKLTVQCQLPQPDWNRVFTMKYVAKEDAFYLSSTIKPLFRVHKNQVKSINYPIVYSQKNKSAQYNYFNHRLGQTQALGDSLSYFFHDDEIYLWNHKQFMRDGYFQSSTSLASKAPFWRAILGYTQAKKARKLNVLSTNLTPLAICKDKEGDLYVAGINGLFIVRKRPRSHFQTLPFFSDKSIRGIKQDPAGHFIIGTYSGTYRYSFASQGLLQNYIPNVIGWDFQFSEKNLIVACEGYDCIVKIPNLQLLPAKTLPISRKKKGDQLLHSRQFQTPILLNHNSFPKRLIKTNSGFLAFVEPQLYFLDFQGNILGRSDLWPNPRRNINETENFASVLSKDSILWLGSYRGLLKIVRVNQGAAFVKQDSTGIPKALKNEHIRTLYEDRQGWLWVGTRENGLLKFDPKNKRLKRYTTHNGLAENTIYSIQGSHADSLLWIGTQHGMSCLNTITGAIVNFFKKDGLADNEFNTGSSYRASDGTLYFGGIRGLTYFKPWRPNFLPSKITPYASIELITRKKNRHQLHTLDHNQTLDIPPQIGLIAIQAHAATHKANPSDIEMEYILSGVQTQWRPIKPAERLMFSDLAPGRYVLSLKARYKNEYWGHSAHFLLRVQPYWYQTWAFKLLVAFASIGFLMLLYRLRIQALKKEMNLRQQISDDLHDDLGTRIYALKALGSQLVNNSSSNLKETAVQFEALGVDILQKIRDIIWGFDPNRDQLVYFIDRLEDFAQKNIKPNVAVFSFENQPTHLDQYLSGLVRHHILMVYQELLVNMIKHTSCQEIHIKLVTQAKGLRLIISNTHQGYKSQTEQEGGRGLESLQKRLLVFKGLLNWTETAYFQEAEIVFPFQ